MPGRGRQTFNKRQKEQQRKEKQQEKLVRRAQKKLEKDSPTDDIGDPFVIEPLEGEEPYDTAQPQEHDSHTE